MNALTVCQARYDNALPHEDTDFDQLQSDIEDLSSELLSDLGKFHKVLSSDISIEDSTKLKKCIMMAFSECITSDIFDVQIASQALFDYGYENACPDRLIGREAFSGIAQHIMTGSEVYPGEALVIALAMHQSSISMQQSYYLREAAEIVASSQL